MNRVSKKRWALAAVLLVLLFFAMLMANAAESWRLKVHYKMVDETVCAHFIFDTENACIATRDWYEKVSAWHGHNEYECVLESQCPAQ